MGTGSWMEGDYREPGKHIVREWHKVTGFIKSAFSLFLTFVPDRKGNAMIRRYSEIAPEMYRKALIATAFCADRIKTDSPMAFTALDAINKAIKHKEIFFSKNG